MESTAAVLQYRRTFAAPKPNPALMAPHIGKNFKTPSVYDREAILPDAGTKMSAYGVPTKPVQRPDRYWS